MSASALAPPKSSPEQVHIVVVSKRAVFRDLVRFFLEREFECVVSVLENETKAMEYIRGMGFSPHMIIYEYESGAYLVEDFITYIREHHKPVQFLVCAEKIADQVQGYFSTLPHFRLVHNDELMRDITTLTFQTFQELIKLNTHEWVRLGIDAVEAIEGLKEELWLKLPAGKMVRLFEQGDADKEAIERYRQKGLQFLWVKKPSTDWMVYQIKKQIPLFLTHSKFQFMVRSPHASLEEKNEIKIRRISEELHLDPDFQKEIENILDRVMDAVGKNSKLQNIMKMIKQKDGRVSGFAKEIQLMSFITCFMARKLEWNSRTTLEKLIYACVLHDITLAFKPRLLRLNSLSAFEDQKDDLSTEEQKIFLNHPKEAAQLLKTHFKSAPPDTDTLILQHHEQPNGTGFPGHLTHDKCSPLSQLFIVAHDFVMWVMNEEDPQLDVYFLRAEAKYETLALRKYVTLLRKMRDKS
jgi:response regulator RpfG family c-di-GMP phosphodiesterase